MAFLVSDVELKQNGLIPSARTLTNAVALDTAIVDGNGDQLTGFDSSRPSGAVLTTVASSAVSVTLKASNAARRQLLVYNNSTKTLFIAFSATASATSFTVKLAAGGFYASDSDGYTGVVSGIWSATNGDAQVTEIS